MKFEIYRTSSPNKPPFNSSRITSSLDKYGENTYFVELNSLEELILLVEEYGPIVVNKPYLYKDIFNIEIYDDYRE